MEETVAPVDHWVETGLFTLIESVIEAPEQMEVSFWTITVWQLRLKANAFSDIMDKTAMSRKYKQLVTVRRLDMLEQIEKQQSRENRECILKIHPQERLLQFFHHKNNKLLPSKGGVHKK